MTKDVIISIQGIQTDFVNHDSVEMITTGQYYEKKGKHYIRYIDNDLQQEKETQTTIKITEEKVEIIRLGAANTHMVFEKNQKHMTHYDTPFGALLIGLKTKEIAFDQQESQLQLEVGYQLEINHHYIGENSFKLYVQNKKDSAINLFNTVQKTEFEGEDY